MTDPLHEIERLQVRIAALEDLVAFLLRDRGVPEPLVLAWRRAEKTGTNYALRGAANAITDHERGQRGRR